MCIKSMVWSNHVNVCVITECNTTAISESPPWTSRPSRTCAASAVSTWQVTFLTIFLLYLISLASKKSKLCMQKLGTWRYAKSSGKFWEEILNLNVCCCEYEISKIKVSTVLERSSQKRNFTKHHIWKWQRNDYTNVSWKRITQKELKECVVFDWWNDLDHECQWVQICRFIPYHLFSFCGSLEDYKIMDMEMVNTVHNSIKNICLLSQDVKAI